MGGSVFSHLPIREIFNIHQGHDSEFNIIQQAGHFNFNEIHISRGLCHCEDMEKEARLKLSNLTSIRLKHPVLKAKAQDLYDIIYNGFDPAKHSNRYANIMIINTPDYHTQLKDFKGVRKIWSNKTANRNEKRELLSRLLFPFTYDEIYQIYSGNAQRIFIKDDDGSTLYEEPTKTDNFYADPRFLPLIEKDKALFQDDPYERHAVPNTVRWIVKNVANRIAMEITRIDEIPCTCKGRKEPALAQILPTGCNTGKVICYNSCARTLFAAFKRQLKQVYPPETKETLDFIKFSYKFMDEHGFFAALQSFDYSYSQWFNKMPRHKQDAMVLAAKSYIANGFLRQNGDLDTFYVKFGMFCKREKQAAGGKNRAIANIDNLVKYIMGPVCWALEEFADRFFPGYCGKKNWNDLEDFMKTAYEDGFTTVLQGDGSGFDLSQSYQMRRIDRIIYSKIASRIHHVNVDDFIKASHAQIRLIQAKQMLGNRVKDPENVGTGNIGDALVVGTVFSGASDTTLMNTIRMALYNHYTLQVKGGLKLDVDYKLLAKGDDFMVFVKNPNLPYKQYYDACWMPKDKKPLETQYKPYGIGQILKFLLVGDYSTIDFCSTTVVQDGTDFKIFRRPDRMDPLLHYSRQAVRMTPGQLKQYYQDLAYALRDSAGDAPFYSEYAQALDFAASQINAQPQLLKTGRQKLHLDDDHHLKVHDPNFKLEEMYYDYGHDFVQGLIFRHSTHKVSSVAVLEHFAKYFNFGQIEIDLMRDFLCTGRLYDPIASCLPE